MLSTKPYIYGKLSTDPGILSAVGTTAHITDSWPETFLTYPLIIYQDDNQADGEFADNKPTMSRVRFRVDIFTKIDLATTTAIGQAVATFFRNEFFTCGTNGEVMDPDEGVRHRVMRFSREFFTSDII